MRSLFARLGLGLLISVLAVLGWQFTAACTNQVDRNIDKLAREGEDAESAKMALAMARSAAIVPLIEAFEDRSHSTRARADMADALFRLYLREKEPAIRDVLMAALDDTDAPVRRTVVKILGDLGTAEASGALIDQLARETDHAVHHEILVTLGIIGLEEQRGMNGGFARRITTDKMTPEEKTRFTDLLTGFRQQDLPDSLMLQTLEWLEVIAEEGIVESRNLVLKADLAGAEALLLAARELVPDSKNVNQQLGKFYYGNEEAEKGLQTLFDIGAALRVPVLQTAPKIDGVLDDPAWDGIEPLTEFYQNIRRMRAYQISGQSEAYIGHRDGKLYIGVKGYEPSTENLTAAATQRDENSWEDDCVELFFDPNRDYTTYYQIVINSLGTVFDQYNDGQTPGGDQGWNGNFAHAVKVNETYWSLEIEIPLDQFGQAAPKSGAVWGANLARIRIANASEYGQWAPTYGSALRPDRFGFLVFD